MSKYKNIDISALDLNMLFITSFRYAITRRSYVPPIIADLIRKNKDLLSTNTLKLFIREIDEEIDRLEDPEKSMWSTVSYDLSGYLELD